VNLIQQQFLTIYITV